MSPSNMLPDPEGKRANSGAEPANGAISKSGNTSADNVTDVDENKSELSDSAESGPLGDTDFYEPPEVRPLSYKLNYGVIDEAKNQPKTHPDAVRRSIALPVLWFLVCTYAVTIGAFLFLRLIPGTPNLFSAEELTAAIAAISGLQGLAAAIVGFYFGIKQGEGEQQKNRGS